LRLETVDVPLEGREFVEDLLSGRSLGRTLALTGPLRLQ
jgi:hypothetical protein